VRTPHRSLTPVARYHDAKPDSTTIGAGSVRRSHDFCVVRLWRFECASAYRPTGTDAVTRAESCAESDACSNASADANTDARADANTNTSTDTNANANTNSNTNSASQRVGR
jgi:hypothetical protein